MQPAVQSQKAELPEAKPRATILQRLVRDKATLVPFVILLLITLSATFAPLLTPFDPAIQDLSVRFQTPSAQHWLGTDDFGRDLATRLLYGGRVSLFIGFASVTFGVLFGVPLGLAAGFFRYLDTPIMRLMDVILSFPRLLLAIAVVAALGAGLTNAILAISIGTIPIFCRLVRSAVLTIREMDYVHAARALGQSEVRILFRHVMPNCLAPVMVYATLTFGQAILLSAMLSFLGLGVQPPDPEWGAIITAGRKYLTMAPHISTYPGFVIFITVLCLNIMGDGLRDALDPRLRQ